MEVPTTHTGLHCFPGHTFPDTVLRMPLLLWSPCSSFLPSTQSSGLLVSAASCPHYPTHTVSNFLLKLTLPLFPALGI